jgi:hypothetical protein
MLLFYILTFSNWNQPMGVVGSCRHYLYSVHYIGMYDNIHVIYYVDHAGLVGSCRYCLYSVHYIGMYDNIHVIYYVGRAVYCYFQQYFSYIRMVILLVEETGEHGEYHQAAASH